MLGNIIGIQGTEAFCTSSLGVGGFFLNKGIFKELSRKKPHPIETTKLREQPRVQQFNPNLHIFSSIGSILCYNNLSEFCHLAK